MSRRGFQGWIWWIPIGWAISENFGSLHVVHDNSNFPILRHSRLSSDVVFVDRLSPRFHRFHRGDLVLLHDPVRTGGVLIRRIMAFENDYVATSGRGYTTRVPKGAAWFEAANQTPDSKLPLHCHPAPAALMYGRAVCIVWPPNRWTWLKSQVPPGKVLVFDSLP